MSYSEFKHSINHINDVEFLQSLRSYLTEVSTHLPKANGNDAKETAIKIAKLKKTELAENIDNDRKDKIEHEIVKMVKIMKNKIVGKNSPQSGGRRRTHRRKTHKNRKSRSLRRN
jgi:hypothetical protein